MNYSYRAMLTEAQPANKHIDELARLQALLGEDSGGWVEGVSYWSDYLTIIDLESAGEAPLRWAS